MFRPDPKPTPKPKKKKVYKYVKKATGEKEVFQEIWNERPHESQIDKSPLGEAASFMFMHVLAKGQNKYPKFKLNKQNIVLATLAQHHNWDNARHKCVSSDWDKIWELEESLKQQYKEEHEKK
jgi:hypothetical protein